MLTKTAITFLRFAAGRNTQNDLQPHAVKSILLVELARLGDVITILPAIPLLRSYFPNARITLLVDQTYVSLLNVLELDAEARGFKHTDSLLGLWSMVQEIRELKADLACSMSPGKRNAVATLASGASGIVGYLAHVDTHTPYLSSTPVEGFGVRLNENVSFHMESIGERPMKVLKALGVESAKRDNCLTLKKEWLLKVRRSLTERGILPSHPFVAIHPFSGWDFRSWPAEKFSLLAHELLKEGWESIVFVCSREEEPGLHEIRKQFVGNEQVKFFPSTDAAETAAVISEASMFIGNDSGPLHLASGLGVPSVGLFGPAWPELTAPSGFKGVALHKQVECSPCNQRICVRPENPCMNLITPGEVVESVRRVKTSIPSVTAHA